MRNFPESGGIGSLRTKVFSSCGSFTPKNTVIFYNLGDTYFHCHFHYL